VVQRATEALAGNHLTYQVGGAVVVLAALSAPVLAAGFWVAGGAGGPLGKTDPDAVPAFVHGPGGQRTLVLHREPSGRVSYTLLRDARPRLGESEVMAGGRAHDRLDDLVAGLAAGREGDDGPALTRMGVQYILVPHPKKDPITNVLDSSPELTRLSRTDTFAVWRLQSPSARMMLLQGPTVTPLPAGRINARMQIPPGSGLRTLLLAEPSDGGWDATLNGESLKEREVDGWAQAYDMPAAGGEFQLTRSMTMRHTWLVVQGIAVLLVAVLALPGAQADNLMFTADQDRTGERTRRRSGDRMRIRVRGRGRRGRRRGSHVRVEHDPPPSVEEPKPEEVT
ncbi:MAG: glycosyltransferase family 2 protein, partial [Spirillospora sp.]